MKLYATLFGLVVEIDAGKAWPVSERWIEAHGRLFAFDENLFFSLADAERKLWPARRGRDARPAVGGPGDKSAMDGVPNQTKTGGAK